MICCVEEAWAAAGSIHLPCCCCRVLAEVHKWYGALQQHTSYSAQHHCCSSATSAAPGHQDNPSSSRPVSDLTSFRISMTHVKSVMANLTQSSPTWREHKTGSEGLKVTQNTRVTRRSLLVTGSIQPYNQFLLVHMCTG
jgi:hypothetical protein